MSSLLQRLHMHTTLGEDDDGLSVEIPSFRPDVAEWVDLAEEVARMYGYNRIPTRLPAAPVAEPQPPGKREAAEAIREQLAASGLQEAVTFAFTSPRSQSAWRWDPNDARARPIALANPLGEEQGLLRTSLLPNLLDAIGYNSRQHEEQVALFEVGRVFLPHPDPGQPLPWEPMHLGFVLMGAWQADGWQGEEQTTDFFLAKGLVERLAERLRLSEISWVAVTDEAGFHPGRSAQIRLGDRSVGVVGELHPDLLQTVGLRQRAVAAEIDLEAWLEVGQAAVTYQAIPRYPAAHLDLALIVPNERTAATIAAAIRTAAGSLLERLSLFDVYEGPSLGDDRRSLAFRLVYRSSERTLQEEEITRIHEQVRQAVRLLGAELRS